MRINTSKRAQVTIVLVGVLLILSALVGVWYWTSVSGTNNLAETTNPLQNFIRSCLERTSLDGIKLLGAQGGYIDLPEQFATPPYANIAYGVRESKNVLVSRTTMARELETYIGRALPLCTANFSVFPELSVGNARLEPQVTILDDEVVVKAEWPLSVRSADATTTMSEFLVDVPIRLGHVHDKVLEAALRSENDPQWIDLTEIGSTDLVISVFPYTNDTHVYFFEDPQSTFGSQRFMFLSAFHFPLWITPTLSVPSEINGEVGHDFRYQIEATGSDVATFSDNTPMFEISQNGLISFVPEIPGVHDVLIRVEDEKGYYDEKSVRFVIS